MTAQSEALKITVSARALHQVLGALVGPSHYIRELQATRNLPGIENPINTLIEEYNAGIEASRAAIAKHGGAA
jgi:hypothetical protein